MVKSKKLTKEELKNLVGGFVVLSARAVDTDVKNSNGYLGCVCTYNNQGAIDNSNTVQGCRCECI
ncbi:MAG: hypothetical protein LBE91_02745 [Tannerella sp.]|jgi:hypothetical protein|nr:hypothetical protein [Tannerella sp.]